MPNVTRCGPGPARPLVVLGILAALTPAGLAFHTRREHFAAGGLASEQSPSLTDGGDDRDDWLDALRQLDAEAADQTDPSDPWGQSDLPDEQHALEAAVESLNPQEMADFEQLRAGSGTVVAMSHANGAFSTSCLQGCPGVDPNVTMSRKPEEETTMLRVTDTVVKMSSWFGRMGNNLVQLANVIFYARATNRTSVILPSGSRRLIPILELPPIIQVRPCDGEDCPNPSCHLRGGLKAGTFFGRCDNLTKADYQGVYRGELLRFATRGTVTSCLRQRSRRQGLTIHLRSGDLLSWAKAHFQARFAPCAFFTKIIRDFGFKRVLIVTEDLQHPCARELQRQNPAVEVEVQHGDVMTDATAIMTALHLAVGSPSTFSQVLPLFNLQLKDYFVPGKCDCRTVRKKGVFPRNLWCYNVDGMYLDGDTQNRTAADIQNYITNTSVPVKLLGVCNDLQAAPFEGSVMAYD